MAWDMRGQLVETCSCNMLCPCWFGVKELMVMDEGWCASTLLFRIQQGNSDGVTLGGRTLVLGLDFPGPTLLDGNGTVRMYIDDSATAEQRRELEEIMQGKKGGPMEVVGGLVSRWLPTQATRIDVQEHNGSLSATVGNYGQIRSERLKNEAGQTMTMQNTGFVVAFQFDNQTADLAPSTGTRWSDPEMPRQFESKSGVVASFTWSGS
jgi:hypothetical protein